MRIGLIDVDSKIPNMALMKISKYYKTKGDNVSFAYPLNYKSFDKIYASSIFDFSDKSIVPKRSVKGGTGYNNNLLPDEIEKQELDYDLYPDCDFTYQKYSKGCIRNCSFCVVPKAEGKMQTLQHLNINPRGKYIYVLDNNFFASPNWKESIKHLISLNQPVKFEGVDIKVLNNEMVDYLDQVKIKGHIHIAWDDPKENIDRLIEKKIKHKKRYRYMAYVLIGFDTTPEEDLYRVERLRELKIDPYVMPFDKDKIYQKKFARWVNHKAIFKTVEWEDYR